MTYKADFEEERRDRERISGQIEEYKDSVDQLYKQNQQLRDTIEELLHQNRLEEEKLHYVSAKKDLHSQVDTLNEELLTARAQIRGYKTQSDGLRMELEDLRKQALETKEVLQQSLQQAQENQEKVCPIIFFLLFKNAFVW